MKIEEKKSIVTNSQHLVFVVKCSGIIQVPVVGQKDEIW